VNGGGARGANVLDEDVEDGCRWMVAAHPRGTKPPERLMIHARTASPFPASLTSSLPPDRVDIVVALLADDLLGHGALVVGI
jgi:hypothetical protein